MMTRPFGLPLLLTILVCGSSNAWVLEINKNGIIPEATNDVQLICKGNLPPDADAVVKVIHRIRITRDPYGSKSTLVDFRIGTNKTTSNNNDIVVSHIYDPNGLTFLKVTWPVATKDTSGYYGCEIDGFDDRMDFAGQHVTPVKIKEYSLTLKDVRDLIRSLTDSYQKEQQQLALDVINLKSDLKKQEDKNQEMNRKTNETVESMKQFCTDQVEKIEQQNQKEIEKVREEFLNKTTCQNESNYVTKGDLASESSDLKANFVERISIYSQTCDEKQTHLETLINTTKRDNNQKFNQLKSDVLAFEVNVNKRIDNLERNRNVSITTVVECPATDTQWPDGTFGFVKPKTGCPGFKYVNSFSYDDLFVPSADLDMRYFDLPKYHLSSDSGNDKLEFCLNMESNSNLTKEWPQGSYCLNAYEARCPPPFQFGKIEYMITVGSKEAGFLPVSYCCRSDGHPDVPISLPVQKPFFMYRNQGVCQRVNGMNVKDDMITMATDKYSPQSHISMTSIHPDTIGQGHSVALCYYYP